MQRAKFGDEARCVVERRRDGDAENLRVGGVFHVECYDKDGNHKWTEDFHNLITDAGINAMLDAFLRNQTQPTAFFLGLVNNASFTTGYAAGDTMASHAGWTEFTGYSGTDRIGWTPAAAASKSIANTTTSDFSITSSGTIKGVFLTETEDRSTNSGLLFSAGNFTTGNQAVTNGDTIKVTYTVSGASA